MASRKRPQPQREDEIIAALQADALSVKQRRRLLRELAQHRRRRSLEVLREHLASENDRIADAALWALHERATEGSVDAIIEALSMPPGPRFTLAVYVLGEARVRRAIPALVDCLERRGEALDEGDRRMVVLTFQRLPHRSEVPVLSRELRTGGPRLRKAAALSLMRIRAPESRAALETAADELSWLRGRSVRRALRQRQRIDRLAQ